MVFKVSKGGVRTGNTLRGLNSARTKRYGRHACLLGSTSLGKRDFTRLIRDSSDDNQLVRETLGQTDVLLSLNKKQRWRLPAMIGHMIREGEFNRGPVVSLLERHKLKRKANCVSLISNNPRMSSITPKQKTYFTFSLDSIADDHSVREKKKARAEELKRPKPSVNILKKANKKQCNTIETYTVDGNSTRKTPIGRGSTEKPEYRLEVFYPCPQSCSLTYNPKYTDVIVGEGKSEKMEVKSVVKTQKKGLSIHRKRITTQRIEHLYCHEIEADVSKMWEECDENLDDDANENDYSKPSDIYSMERTVDALLFQAQKTKDLCILKKESYQKKTKKKSKRTFSETEINPDKSHIVFIENETENVEQNSIFVANNTKDVVGDEDEQNISGLDYCRVILPTSEVDPEELRSKYGSRYAEASCVPRRFLIDITDDINHLIVPPILSSYLVCVHEGFYDEGLVAYRIALNSVVGCKVQALADALPFAMTTIPGIMNAVVCHVLDMKEKNYLEFAENAEVVSRDVNNGGDFNFINSRIKLRVEVFDPSNEISKISISNEEEPDAEKTKATINYATLEAEDLFCDVCYASVTSSRVDCLSGTKLKSCGHLLCDKCWASHFRMGLKNGKTIMTCAGYDCNTKVGPVTLMSILNVSDVALLLRRQTEEKIETMDNAKWCPHPGCGRVIKVDSSSKDLCVDVGCACGQQLCFSCSGPAHWPAKCEQAEEYFDKLPSLTPAKEYVEEQTKSSPFLVNEKTNRPETIKINGHICPRCKRFIEKNGGCPHVICKCGYQMCWTCMKSMDHFFHICMVDQTWLNKHTGVLLIKHALSREIVSPDSEERADIPPKIQKNKQKASLYQKALQQREESTDAVKYNMKSQTKPLIEKMVRETQKYPLFKREILTALPENISNADDISLVHFDVSRCLKKFLNSTVEMKKELHHVTEYTFILLRDTPHSVTKQRILKLANDLSGICSIVTSILELRDNQNAKTAFRRLVDLQSWGKRALDALIRTTRSLRQD